MVESIYLLSFDIEPPSITAIAMFECRRVSGCVNRGKTSKNNSVSLGLKAFNKIGLPNSLYTFSIHAWPSTARAGSGSCHVMIAEHNRSVHGASARHAPRLRDSCEWCRCGRRSRFRCGWNLTLDFPNMKLQETIVLIAACSNITMGAGKNLL